MHGVVHGLARSDLVDEEGAGAVGLGQGGLHIRNRLIRGVADLERQIKFLTGSDLLRVQLIAVQQQNRGGGVDGRIGAAVAGGCLFAVRNLHIGGDGGLGRRGLLKIGVLVEVIELKRNRVIAVDRVGLDLEGEVEVSVGHIAVRIALDDDIRHGLAVGGIFQFKRELLGLARNHGLDAEVGKRRILEILVPLIGQVQLEIDLVVAAVFGDCCGAKGDVVNRLQLGRIRTVRNFTTEIFTVFAETNVKRGGSGCTANKLAVRSSIAYDEADSIVVIIEIIRADRVIQGIATCSGDGFRHIRA